MTSQYNTLLLRTTAPIALAICLAVPALAPQWRSALARLVARNALPLTDPVGDD